MFDIQDRFHRESGIRGLLTVRNAHRFGPLVQGFDLLHLVISDKAENNDIIHYIKDNLHIQERYVSPAELERQLQGHDQRKWSEWMLQGEIALDYDGYLAGLRVELLNYPVHLREKRLMVEFASFVRCFLDCRHYLEEDHDLDAYSSILEALIHWARIVIIEVGDHPETKVWKQVKQVNLGVYKLYEELTQSGESIKQRVQLVLLACDFSVMSKIRQCCSLLLTIMKTRHEPWRVRDLMAHPELSELSVDLSMLLQKLVKRSVIREVLITGMPGETELAYSAIS